MDAEILVCGSLAYDTSMVFPDRFKNHILPDKIHILNVSFMVPQMRREFGGCAGNIAYNLRLLDTPVHIMATVGEDSQPYLERLQKLQIGTQHVRTIEHNLTAQAFITTDLDDNQITAFHPGAMLQSHQNQIKQTQGIKLGIVAPSGFEGMVQHCEGFHANNIPFIFDPGQGLPMFDRETLLKCLQQASWCTVNDYEIHLLCEKTGLSAEAIAQNLHGLIVTLGGEGSKVYQNGQITHIPAANIPTEHIIDPTGCGDAYRAGLLYGLKQGWQLTRAAQLGSIMGAIKIETRGSQNHTPQRTSIALRYKELFNEPL